MEDSSPEIDLKENPKVDTSGVKNIFNKDSKGASITIGNFNVNTIIKSTQQPVLKEQLKEEKSDTTSS